jgi:hypothetical protein
MSRHLEITTNFPCINNCSYCPQAVLKRAYKGKNSLSLEDFKNILVNVPKDVEIHFSAFSEPFANQESPDMMRHAVDQGYVVHVYTTTNGLDIDSVSDINFASFHIHNIGLANGKNIPYATHFDAITAPISRGGHLWEIEAKEGQLGCRRNDEYSQNVMLPNGDVALCCMDYGLEGNLGNLFDTNFNDLKRTGVYKLCKTCEFSYVKGTH